MLQENLLIQQSAEKNWYAMEKELIRERGIWGPEEDNPLDKWKLGMTEGKMHNCFLQVFRLTRIVLFLSCKILLAFFAVNLPFYRPVLIALLYFSGPRRMRKLMCKHEHFYTNYPYRDEIQREQVTMTYFLNMFESLFVEEIEI